MSRMTLACRESSVYRRGAQLNSPYQFDTPAGTARLRGPDASRKQNPLLPRTIWNVALRQQQSIRKQNRFLQFVLSADGLNNRGKKENNHITHSLLSLSLHYSNEKPQQHSLLPISFIYCAKVHGNKSFSIWYCSEIHERIPLPSLPPSVMNALVKFIHSYTRQTLCVACRLSGLS